MIDGYIYSILVWLLLILHATRWLDHWWSSYSHPERVSRLVLGLMILLLFCQGWSIPLPGAPQYFLNISGIILPGVVCLAALWRDRHGFVKQMLAVILFLSVLYATCMQLFLWDPVLMVLPPLYLFPLLFTFLLILVTRHLFHLWPMMGCGLIGGELLHQWFLLDYVDQVTAGEAAFRDQLALGLFTVTTVNILFNAAIKSYQSLSTVVKEQWRRNRPTGRRDSL